MEFNFDLMSFAMGGAAVMLSTLLAQLFGYVAAMLCSRVVMRRKASNLICPVSMTKTPLLLSGDSLEAAQTARGRTRSGS